MSAAVQRGGRVAIYVQHLLGVGHLRRAGLIAEALKRDGCEVLLISGGRPVPGLIPADLTVHQLPSLAIGDDGWSDLRDAHGLRVDDSWLGARSRALLDVVDSFQPDLVITEAFPFARRQFAFELDPLVSLMGARGVPLVCSVRDIVQPPKSADRAREVLARLKQFDAVLVHGDPRLADLSDSFPLAAAIRPPVHHTGLIAPTEEASREVPNRFHDVIISLGGSRVGAAIAQATVTPSVLAALDGRSTLLLCGPHCDEATLTQLRERAGRRVEVQRFVSDLPARLHRAQLSISFAGYNTVTEVLSAGCRAVFIAFTGEEGQTPEVEQTLRARALARHDGYAALTDSEVTDGRLADAIRRAFDGPSVERRQFDMNGASRTATLIRSLLARLRQ